MACRSFRKIFQVAQQKVVAKDLCKRALRSSNMDAMRDFRSAHETDNRFIRVARPATRDRSDGGAFALLLSWAKRPRPGLFLLGILLIGECATPGPRIPFTRELIRKYRLSDLEIRDLQMFVSHDIVLHREISEDEKKTITHHSLRLTGGRRVEEITFNAGTPGVILREERGAGYHVAFESGESTLFFCAPSDFERDGLSIVLCEVAEPEAENEHRKGRFKLVGDKWERVPGGWTSIISYGSDSYSAASTSFEAYLMIDADALNRLIKKERVVPGRRLP